MSDVGSLDSGLLDLVMLDFGTLGFWTSGCWTLGILGTIPGLLLQLFVLDRIYELDFCVLLCLWDHFCFFIYFMYFYISVGLLFVGRVIFRALVRMFVGFTFAWGGGGLVIYYYLYSIIFLRHHEFDCNFY